MERGDFLTVAEAAKQTPQHVHASVVWRWMRIGLKARTGERIRLKHVRIGSRVFTTQADLDEFFRVLAEADVEFYSKRQKLLDQENSKMNVSRGRTEKQRAHAVAQARRELGRCE
ncbi:MAG: hypothetical protein AMXMBFR84_16630 [Candidatus Hydrogenedentota bacterium]